MVKFMRFSIEISAIVIMRITDLLVNCGVPSHWSNLPPQNGQNAKWFRPIGKEGVVTSYVSSQIIATYRNYYVLKPAKNLKKIATVIFVASFALAGNLPARSEGFREVYKVQEGDILDIHPLDQNQADLYPIPPDGRLYMPQLGEKAEIYTLGKTLAEIGQALRNAQNLQTPVAYAVKYAGRTKGTVRIFGPAKSTGLKDSNDLLTIVAQCEGSESWNGKVSVTYPDTKKTSTYDIPSLVKDRNLVPYVPTGSTVSFEKRFLNRALDPIKPASTWLGVLAAIALVAIRI